MSFAQRVFCCFLLTLLPLLSTFSLVAQTKKTDRTTVTGDEFVGPFASWLNVKTDFGAAGDGVHDDTKALQTAMNTLAGANKSIVLYLPAGIYLISGTLKLNNAINVSVIGESPDKTILKWGGPASGIMFQLNGTAYSKFDRITFNGMRNAAVAVDESYSGSGGHFDTANEWADDYFMDVATGIRGGFLGHGFAEVTIERDKFIRNTVAGVSLGNFNALDVWVRHCLFEDCNYGVTNIAGAGNFKVYSCLFKNSTSADIAINNTGEFSVRENTSVNSKVFYYASFSRNPCSQTIAGNTIIDPVANTAVVVKNQGPVLFTDNIIRSRSAATAPVVLFDNHYPYVNTVSLNNTFTVANGVAADHIDQFGDKVVAVNDLVKLGSKILPAAPINLHRKLFEVPVGANAQQIQAIINKAAKLSGARPVVHFPYGTYYIASTLSIPANSDIQLVGDGFGDVHATFLTWEGTGTGPIIHMAGPSKATFRDFTIQASTDHKPSKVTAIQFDGVDQPNGLIFLKEVQMRSGGVGIRNDQISHTLLWSENCDLLGLTKGLIAGRGRTIIYNGSSSDNALSYEVKNGGNLLVQDSWYEGRGKSSFVSLEGDGTFCAAGDHIYTPASLGQASFRLNHFSGNVTLAGSFLDGNFEIAVPGPKARVLVLSTLFEKQPSVNQALLSSHLNLLSNRVRATDSRDRNGGSDALPDSGKVDQSLLETMLQPARSVHQIMPHILPGGVTDTRLYRIMINYANEGISLR